MRTTRSKVTAGRIARRQPGDPRGKVVAITGAARGIGFATARAFLDAGARVAIGDVDADLAHEQGGKLGAWSHELDVTDAGSFGNFLDATARELGPVDVLVNNAGIMPLGPLPDEPDQLTRRIVSVNLLGALTGTKLAMTHMMPRGSGHIVNVASAVGRVAVPHAATYSATKFAVVGLTEAVRGELRGTGVHASVVLPAVVNTELGGGLRTGPWQHPVEPDDVAAAILGVVRRPRFETWVPRSNYYPYRVMAALPRSWLEAMGRATGGTETLATADPVVRAAYEDRVRSLTTERAERTERTERTERRGEVPPR